VWRGRGVSVCACVRTLECVSVGACKCACWCCWALRWCGRGRWNRAGAPKAAQWCLLGRERGVWAVASSFFSEVCRHTEHTHTHAHTRIHAYTRTHTHTHARTHTHITHTHTRTRLQAPGGHHRPRACALHHHQPSARRPGEAHPLCSALSVASGQPLPAQASHVCPTRCPVRCSCRSSVQGWPDPCVASPNHLFFMSRTAVHIAYVVLIWPPMVSAMSTGCGPRPSVRRVGQIRVWQAQATACWILLNPVELTVCRINKAKNMGLAQPYKCG